MFRLRSLFQREKLESEMSEQIRLHLEMHAEANRAAGMSPDEARDAARREFGGVEQVKEYYRDEFRLNSLEDCWRDVRHSVRGLWREKSFTVTVLLIVALCLGANVVIFTVVHSILLAPLPFNHPEQLVVVDNSYTKAGLEHVGASVPNYYEWREGVTAFSESATYEVTMGLTGEPGSPERVKMVYGTPSFFRVLGTTPQIGRFPIEEEGFYGGKIPWNVAVISDSFWRQHFGADPGVLGKTMQVEGTPRYIIGVLPPGFRFLSTEAPLWVTMVWTAGDWDPRRRHANLTSVIARLKPGSTIAQAQSQVDAINARAAKDDPDAERARADGFKTTVRGLHAAHVAQARPALLLVEGGVLLLLFVGAVNVANLLMVRASARAKEVSVRLVLGASRLSILARQLTETTILTGLGAALGIGLAAAALQFIGKLGVDQLPLGAVVHLDWPVVIVSVGAVMLLALLLVGPLAALTFRTDLAPVLASESRSGTISRGAHRLRHTLIVVQIALAFVLLTGAGLLGISFKKVLAVDPGFRPENVLSAWIGLTWSSYKEDPSRGAFVEKWVQRVRALPGVDAVGLGTLLPVLGDIRQNRMVPPTENNMTIEGHEGRPGEVTPLHHFSMIHGDYFAALGIPLLEGRVLDEGDYHGKGNVCVIDEDFARHYWPGRSAVGYRVSLGTRPINERSLRIVGVVGTVKQNGLSEKDARGMLYVPMTAGGAPFRMATVVRSSVSPKILAPELRKALLDIDPLLPLEDAKLMDTRIEESLVFQRSLVLSAALFAALAVLLAAVGVYGVMAYAVVQRQREIGVRMALGAQPFQILVLFLSMGGSLLWIGILFGAIASFVVGRLIESLLFGVSPNSPGVFLGTAAALTLVVLLASTVPSHRAATVSVMESLRRE
jgi:predicted permease